MMNFYTSKLALLFTAGVLSLSLSGCGDDSNDGNPGNPGGPAAESAAKLNFNFEQSLINNGKPQVDFFVSNEQDLPVVGLQQFRFSAAQLLPVGVKGAGESSQWQYFGDENCQVTAKCPGDFVDHKNGHYSYTFAMDLTSNDKVSFDPQLPQRIIIRSYPTPLPSGAPMPNTNAFIDFSADGSEPQSSRIIVTNETCNDCHGDISTVKHGGAYNEVQYCATCHTDGKVSKDSSHFNVMIHAKHKDLTLGSLNDCASCHKQDEAAPDWSNWSRIPTAITCGSCHTNIDFISGKGHPAQGDNSNCIACHNSEWTTDIHSAKTHAKKFLIDSYGVNTQLLANNDKTATISVAITDKQGVELDAQTLIKQIKQLETITNIGPNSPIMGYNPAPITGYKKVTKDLVKDGELGTNVTIVEGKFSYTTETLPFAENDTDTAFTFVGLGMCNDGEKFVDCTDGIDFTGMKASIAFATLSGAEPSFRHTDSINTQSCINCHGDSFDIHKGYHPGFVISEQLGRIIDGEMVISLDGCVTCHTPHGTFAAGGNKGALEMKLHKTHMEKAYSLVGDNCSQCHSSFNLDSFAEKGALATSSHLYSTPITATCTSCHSVGSDYMSHSQADLEQFGAIVDGDFTQAQQAAQSETCLLCHKPSIENHGAVRM